MIFGCPFCRILQKLLAYPEVQRPDPAPPRQAPRPALNAIPANVPPSAPMQQGPGPFGMGAPPAHGLQVHSHIPEHHQDGSGPSAHPGSPLDEQALPQLHQQQGHELHRVAHGGVTPLSAQPLMAGGVQPGGRGLHARGHALGPVTGSQGSSGPSSRPAKTSLPQVSNCTFEYSPASRRLEAQDMTKQVSASPFTVSLHYDHATAFSRQFWLLSNDPMKLLCATPILRACTQSIIWSQLHLLMPRQGQLSRTASGSSQGQT